MDIVLRLREFASDAASIVTGDRVVAREAADEIERLRAYAARLIERLERCPDETRAIDADLAARRKAQ